MVNLGKVRCPRAASQVLVAISVGTLALGLASVATAAPVHSTGSPGPGHSASNSGRLTQVVPELNHRRSPMVIGHRGDPGNRPEDTLPSYRMAIRRGADYVEASLVETKDGILIARHEDKLNDTTDVASRSRFKHLERTRKVDGTTTTGWFSEDFSYAQVEKLRAVERWPSLRPQNVKYDGRYKIPTFNRVIDLVQHMEGVEHRRIGIYAELKQPGRSRTLHLPMEGPVVSALKRHDLTKHTSAVILESYSAGSLKRLQGLTHVRLVQLLNPRGQAYGGSRKIDDAYPDLANRAGLRAVNKYASGVAVPQSLVIPTTKGDLGERTRLVTIAHHHHLFIHVYTFRDENHFLPTQLWRGTNPITHGHNRQELEAFFNAGVDGVFDDYPGTAYAARAQWEASLP